MAILGVGPTGMMHVLLAKSFGFSKIFCMDLNDFRLDFVKKFGVTAIRSDNPDLVQENYSDDTYYRSRCCDCCHK